MTKKSISILCLTALYSFFFYEQHVGINFLLFTVSALALFFFQDKTALKSKAVLLLSFGALFTASFAVLNSSNLSMWATIVALAVIPGVFMNKRSALFIDFCTSIVTTVISIGYMVVDIIESHKSGKGKGILRMLKYIVPVVFIVAFFFIYRAMNPLFEKFTREIAEFISLGWVFFTLGGFFLVYSFYKQKRATAIDDWEKNWVLNIIPDKVKTPKWNEAVAFILLFLVLNIMLVVVNAMDVNYLYLGKGMPEGITHKEFVHKGVGMLILSIILGISILLFFFRGALNFSTNKYFIKILAYLWVAQNIFMVVSTNIRNTMYVDAALLTYKRIGVYFWLFFALIGLLLTFYKLTKNKSVWFMTRHFITSLFVTLLLSSVIDWDMTISNFNLKRAHQMDEISSLDKHYLLSLSEGNIADLYEIKEKEGFEIDSIYSYDYYRNNQNHSTNANWLDCKVFDFLEDDSYGDWRSYSARRNRVRQDVEQLHEEGKLNSLNLQGHYIKSIEPLNKITNLIELNLSSNNFNSKEKLAGINGLPHLKKLSLNNNYIFSLDTLHKNNNLTHLELGTNDINKLKFLKNFPMLDSLELSNNKLTSLVSLPIMNKLTSLNLDGNPLNDISKLEKLSQLKYLSLNQIINNVGNFPKLKHVEHLSLRGSKNVLNFGFPNLHQLPSLYYLDVSSNELAGISVLFNSDNSCKTPSLKTLIMSSNSINSLYGIESLTELEYLDASYNNLYHLIGIEKLKNLKQLYLGNNQINNISVIATMLQLRDLNLSNNNIKNFSALENLNQLTHLNLSGTSFNDVEFIKSSASTLKVLNLNACRLKNFKQLESFQKLSHLSVSYLRKEDVETLKKIKTLKTLSISNTEETIVDLIKSELKGIAIY